MKLRMLLFRFMWSSLTACFILASGCQGEQEAGRTTGSSPIFLERDHANGFKTLKLLHYSLNEQGYSVQAECDVYKSPDGTERVFLPDESNSIETWEMLGHDSKDEQEDNMNLSDI